MAIAVIVGVQPASAERSLDPPPAKPPSCTVSPIRTVAVLFAPDVAPDVASMITTRLKSLAWQDLTITDSPIATGKSLVDLLMHPGKRAELFGDIDSNTLILVVGDGGGDTSAMAQRAAHGVISTDTAKLSAVRFGPDQLSNLLDEPFRRADGTRNAVPKVRETGRKQGEFELLGTSQWAGANLDGVSVAQASSPDKPLTCRAEPTFSLPAMLRMTGVRGDVTADDLSVRMSVGLANADESGATKQIGTAARADDSWTRFWPVAVVALAAAIAALAFALYTRSRAVSADPAGMPGAGGFLPAPPLHANGGPVVAPHPARYFEEPVMEHTAPVPPAPGWTAAIPGGTAIRASDLGLLRVAPHLTARGHSWSHATSKWILASGWVEKVVGKGEDAEPVMRVHDSGRGLLAVFDGTGGAGAASARRLPDGSDLSGAYVASRLAREVSESWFTQLIASGSGVRPDPAQLQDQLARALQDEMTYPDVPQSIVKGRLQRILPTTLAGVAFASTGDELQIEAMWAGDSRCYALTPGKGLQVLTIDDTPETDALALIRNDQPMSNLVCADRPFAINRLGYRLAQPAMLVTATDGCFGYVRTPAHFEYLILKTLMDSPGPQEWADQLVEAVAAIASDDCSFSMAGIGFGDFVTMREMLRPRFTFLADTHWAPFQRAQSNEEVEALRIGSWESYRNTYHELALQDARR